MRRKKLFPLVAPRSERHRFSSSVPSLNDPNVTSVAATLRPSIIDRLSFPILDLLRSLTRDLSFKVYCPRNAKDHSRKNRESHVYVFLRCWSPSPLYDSDERK